MKNINRGNLKSNSIIIIMILQILFFIVCLTAISSQISRYAQSWGKEKKSERFASVKVCSGETLWEISKRYYTDEYKNMNSYVKKIMQLNNMTDEEINSGAYVIIPYYDQKPLQ